MTVDTTSVKRTICKVWEGRTGRDLSIQDSELKIQLEYDAQRGASK